MIYQIRIEQIQDGTFYRHEFTESYENVETLRKAFDSMNSEVMFGEKVEESIAPCWEHDCQSVVVRKKRNWTTKIKALTIRPITANELRLYGAFSCEKSMRFLAMY